MLFLGLLVSLVAVAAARLASDSTVHDANPALATKQRCLRSSPFIMLPLANHTEVDPMYVLLQQCILVSS